MARSLLLLSFPLAPSCSSRSPHSLSLPLAPLAPLASLTPLTPLAPSRYLLLPLAPLAPSHSLSLSLTPLTPSCSSRSLSLPSHTNGQCRVGVCYTMFWCPHHLCGGKGREGARGARGSEREQGEQEWSERGQEGARGARGSEGSEMNVMLGFKAPTTSGGKNFDDDIYCLCVPTTWKYSPHPMSIHIAAKGLCRSPPWAKKFWGKNSQGC